MLLGAILLLMVLFGVFFVFFLVLTGIGQKGALNRSKVIKSGRVHVRGPSDKVQQA